MLIVFFRSGGVRVIIRNVSVTGVLIVFFRCWGVKFIIRNVTNQLTNSVTGALIVFFRSGGVRDIIRNVSVSRMLIVFYIVLIYWIDWLYWLYYWLYCIFQDWGCEGYHQKCLSNSDVDCIFQEWWCEGYRKKCLSVQEVDCVLYCIDLLNWLIVLIILLIVLYFSGVGLWGLPTVVHLSFSRQHEWRPATAPVCQERAVRQPLYGKSDRILEDERGSRHMWNHKHFWSPIKRATCLGFSEIVLKKSLLWNVFRLFYTHPWISICMNQKKSQFKSIGISDLKNCIFCLEIDLESFVLGFWGGDQMTYYVWRSLTQTRWWQCIF